LAFTKCESWDDCGKPSVMKFNGEKWVLLGSPEFTDEPVGFNPSALWVGNNNSSGSESIILGTYQKDSAALMLYQEGHWIQVGKEFSNSSKIIDFDNDTPYAAFFDHTLGITVMKYVSNDWVSVGSPRYGSDKVYGLSFFVNQSVPYVSFMDAMNGYKATVMKIVGNDWMKVGDPGFAGSGTIQKIYVDNGVPYIAYTANEYDDYSGIGISVMKFVDDSWVFVGKQKFSNGYVTDLSLIVDNSKPYVAYLSHPNRPPLTQHETIDDEGPRKLTVMSYR
jgi:hypothetical protein